jgi:putative membrane protein
MVPFLRKELRPETETTSQHFFDTTLTPNAYTVHHNNESTNRKNQERKARMMFGYGGFEGVGMIFGGLVGLAVVTLIVLLIIWAARGLRRPGQMGMGASEDPLAIAKARYAKGEISQAEYKKLVKDLKE